MEFLPDALKVLGGIATPCIAYFVVKGIKPDRPNGRAKCEEHSGLLTLTQETHSLLESMDKDNKDQRKEARDDRKTLFNKVDKLEEDIAGIKEDRAYHKGKSSGKKKPSKPHSPFQCLIIDDQAADPIAKYLEGNFQNIFRCTAVVSAKEASKELKNQQFDIALIDLCLNATEDGYALYKYYKEAYPKMKYIIYSGNHPDTISPEIKDIFLLKPFKKEEVIEKINYLFGMDL